MDIPQDLSPSRRELDSNGCTGFIRADKSGRLTAEGLVVQSFDTLLEELATRCRSRCRLQADPQGPSFYQVTEMSPIQNRAFQLLDL